MIKPELTAERLREVLNYDAETGVFTRKLRTARRIKLGEPAGSVSKLYGYLTIMVDLRSYKAHRLAWLYVYGKWPDEFIDHIDGNKLNNRISNLRDVSGSTNIQNQRKPHKRNSTGFLGVTVDNRAKNGRKYMAQIVLGGKHKFLGLYETPELAHEAYLNAKRQMHEGCTI